MNKDIVFISGNFITAHYGHLRLFKYAKQYSTKLVVGIFSDKILKQKSPVNEKSRLKAINGIGYVDESFVITTSLNEVLLNLKPRFILKGSEFKKHKNIEIKVISKFGGRLIFFPDKFMANDVFSYEKGNSKFLQSKNLFNFPNNFIKNHKINIIKLKKIVEKFKTKRVCVIGDVIADEYVYCEEVGISKEDSTLVVKPNKKSFYLGGAGIVASHCASLCSQVDLYSFAAKDNIYKFISNKLDEYSVNNNIHFCNMKSTIKKTRFKKNDKILFRVNDTNQYTIPNNLENKILKSLESKKDYYDLIIFSDFNYGCLSKKIINKILKIFKNSNIIRTGDSQSSSQTGDIKKFKNLDLVTATEYELRLNLNDFQNNITYIANKYIDSYKCRNIIIKLGKNGIFIHSLTDSNNTISDSVRALNSFPKNISGAGDAFLVISSLALASESNIWEASTLGSLGAALHIDKEGNIPINYEEFNNLLD